MNTAAEPSSATANANARAETAMLLLAVLMGLSRVWVGGYSFGTADNAWQVPIVENFAHGEFARDYVFSNPPHLSVYFPVVAALAKRLDTAPLFSPLR